MFNRLASRLESLRPEFGYGSGFSLMRSGFNISKVLTSKKQRPKLRKLINKLPGKALGEYRLLPIFFIFGAALEFSMIHWQVGEVNFYKVYKHRTVEELVEKRLKQERQA